MFSSESTSGTSYQCDSAIKSQFAHIFTLDSVRATLLAETNRPPPRSICTHFKTKGYNPHVTADYVGVPNKNLVTLTRPEHTPKEKKSWAEKVCSAFLDSPQHLSNRSADKNPTAGNAN